LTEFHVNVAAGVAPVATAPSIDPIAPHLAGTGEVLHDIHIVSHLAGYFLF
jgi:hypothetical protein